MDLPESILVLILARLPLKIIARCKSVCKEWKTLLESAFFRDLYLSANRNSSSSWSVVRSSTAASSDDEPFLELEEVISFHGCKRWGLDKSLASYVSSLGQDAKTKFENLRVLACTDGLFLLRAEPLDYRQDHVFYVGNPVSRQWLEVPPPLYCSYYTSHVGLVTHMDNNGILLGYKVVLLVGPPTGCTICFRIYSSETGLWSSKNFYSLLRKGHWNMRMNPISLNGSLHWLYDAISNQDMEEGIVAHDFYTNTEADRFRFTPFPTASSFRISRACSTSSGFLMCTEIVLETLMVWRLNSGEWQLSWEIDTRCLGLGFDCVPVTMHPFDTDTIYLCCHRSIVSLDLRTQKFTVHEGATSCDSDGGRVCVGRLTDMFEFEGYDGYCYSFRQFVLPQWLQPIPNPHSSPYLSLHEP